MSQLKRYNGTSWENVGGSVAPKNARSSSTTDTYSCNYLEDKVIYLSDENTDGSFILYGDGTAICHMKILVQNFNLSVDSNYYFYDLTNIPFPIEFTSAPVVTAFCENTSIYRRLWVSECYGVGTTSIGRITINHYWNSSNNEVYVHITAIGKWK